MIPQNNTSNKTQEIFSIAIKQLGVATMLRKANIRKSCGISAYEIFQFLLIVVFHGKNLWRFLQSKYSEQAGASKNTFYRFMENTTFN